MWCHGPSLHVFCVLALLSRLFSTCPPIARMDTLFSWIPVSMKNLTDTSGYTWAFQLVSTLVKDHTCLLLTCLPTPHQISFCHFGIPPACQLPLKIQTGKVSEWNWEHHRSLWNPPWQSFYLLSGRNSVPLLYRKHPPARLTCSLNARYIFTLKLLLASWLQLLANNDTKSLHTSAVSCWSCYRSERRWS